MKFLIIRLSSLGDIIHSLPLVYRLRQSFPNAQIDWLTGEKGYELLSLIKEIDNIYILSLKNIFLIQKQNYEYVIDVQGLFKSALISKFCLGKKIIGFKNTREFADIFYDKKISVGNLFKTDKHIVDLNLELISDLVGKKEEKIKFLIPKIQKPDNEDVLSTINNKSKKIIVFPSTTWESKLWEMDYWFELIQMISSDSQVYLCASNSDLCFITPLIDKLDLNRVNYKNLVGQTSIKDLIHLIQNVDLVLGLDSAGLHLAGAIKNDYSFPEIIGIYGPTSVVRNGLYGEVERCLYLKDLECIACRKKNCPFGHHKCMEEILPERVYRLVKPVFKGSISGM